MHSTDPKNSAERPHLTRNELQHLSIESLIELVLQLQRNPSNQAEDNTTNIEPERYQQALREQQRRTALLTQLAVELNESLDTGSVVERVLRVVALTLGVRRVSITLFDNNDAQNVELAQAIEDSKLRAFSPRQLGYALGKGLTGWVARSQRSIVISNTANDKEWSDLWDERQFASSIATPIRSTKAVRGVLVAHHSVPYYFSSQDLLWFEGIAAQISIALAAAQRRSDERRRREHALALLSLSQYLTNEHSFKDLAAIVQARSRDVFEAAYALLFLTGNRTAPMLLDTTTIFAELPALQANALIDRAQQAAQQACEQNVPIAPQPREADQDEFALIALPLVHNGPVIGALVLLRHKANQVAFSATVWSLLTVFASVIAATCANMQLILQLQSHTEQLEALVNQRAAQLQQSRDTLRVIFDNDTRGLLLLDDQEKIIAANATFCHWFFGEHPRLLVGKSYAMIWGDLDSKQYIQVDRQKQLPSMHTNETRHLCFVTKSDRYNWYEVSRTTLHNAEIHRTYYVESWSDITIYEDLYRYTVLQEQTSLLGEMVLQVVETTAQHLNQAAALLAQDALWQQTDHAIHNQFVDNARQLQQLAQMAASLHSFYATPRITWEQTNLNDMLRDVEQLVTLQALRDAMTVELDLDMALPTFVAQRSSLQQVFLNLLLLTHTTMQGTGITTITTAWQPAEQCCVVRIIFEHVVVQDEALQKAFDLTALTRPDGLSTGLYVSQLIIERHAGTITLMRQPPTGLMVEIMFPIVQGRSA